MNTKAIGLALILGSSFWFFTQRGGDPIKPTPEPSDVPVVSVQVQESLKSGFADKEREALVWAGMLSALADFVKVDGGTSKPVLQSMDDISQLIEASTAAPVRSMPGGLTVGSSLSSELGEIGKAGDKLTPERRIKIVNLFRGSAYVLESM